MYTENDFALQILRYKYCHNDDFWQIFPPTQNRHNDSIHSCLIMYVACKKGLMLQTEWLHKRANLYLWEKKNKLKIKHNNYFSNNNNRPNNRLSCQFNPSSHLLLIALFVLLMVHLYVKNIALIAFLSLCVDSNNIEGNFFSNFSIKNCTFPHKQMFFVHYYSSYQWYYWCFLEI